MPAIVIDLGILTPAQGFIVRGENANDKTGISLSNAGDINGDGIDDLIIGASYGDNGDVNAGDAYVIFGKVGATRANIDLASLAASDGFIIQGKALGDQTGRRVSNAGDINGDGFDDLIIGAPRAIANNYTAGVAYVIFGKSGATRVDIDLANLSASDGFIIQGDTYADFAGASVSGAGDINGDGIDDIIVGAPYGDNGGTNAGEAYVIFGKVGATRANIDLTNLAASDGFIIQGDTSFDQAAKSVSNAGDINGDGIDDLIIGEPADQRAGNAYVIFGKTGATRANIDLSSLSASDGFTIRGDAIYDFTGYSVSSAGDINGDGIDDLIVAAPVGDNGGYNAGEAYVIFGRAGATRANINLSNLSPGDGFIIQGDTVEDRLGFSVSNAGDIDGDGIEDIIVGARLGDNGGTNAGEAYVIFGKAGATRANIDLTNLTERDGFIIQGDADVDLTGSSVSNAGDINSDGIDDLIVGAHGSDFGGGSAGRAYVIYGSTAYTSPAGTLNGTAAADILNGTTFADQINGLNGNDTLWGGGGNDTLDGGEGNDLIDGGTGSNTLIGGNGIDTLRVSASGSVASISGFEAVELVGGAILTLTGTQFRDGLASNSALSGIGTITVNMDAGVNFSAAGMSFTTTVSTVVNGTSGIDIIKLGLGASTGNTVNSGDGVDQIRGSNGVDTINGGIGNDKIMALGGADVLTGGAGNDQFRFFSASDSGLGAAADRITDFTIGGDRLNFLLIDADAVTAGDQAFNFVGTAAFANTGVGQIRYQDSGADLLVQADVNGDGVADMEIILQGNGTGTLTGADFIL